MCVQRKVAVIAANTKTPTTDSANKSFPAVILTAIIIIKCWKSNILATCPLSSCTRIVVVVVVYICELYGFDVGLLIKLCKCCPRPVRNPSRAFNANFGLATAVRVFGIRIRTHGPYRQQWRGATQCVNISTGRCKNAVHNNNVNCNNNKPWTLKAKLGRWTRCV